MAGSDPTGRLKITLPHGWKERFKVPALREDIVARITPKGVNVPRAEVRRRRIKNKRARAARRLNRRHS